MLHLLASQAHDLGFVFAPRGFQITPAADGVRVTGELRFQIDQDLLGPGKFVLIHQIHDLPRHHPLALIEMMRQPIAAIGVAQATTARESREADPRSETSRPGRIADAYSIPAINFRNISRQRADAKVQ